MLLTAGILVEGFTSLIASMVGTGTGLSSFRDNVSGVLGVTKVDLATCTQFVSVCPNFLCLSHCSQVVGKLS